MHKIASPDLTSPQFKANPHPFYARLREEAPVWRTTLPDKRTAWLVTRYEDVAGVLKDDSFAKDPLNAQDPEQRAEGPWVPGFLQPLEQNMLDLDEPDHRRLRTLVSKAFTPRLIEKLRGRIEAICQELLDAMERQGRAELVRDYALPLPATVIAELLGIPASDHRKFHRWSNRIVSVSSDRDVWRALPAALAFVRYLRKMSERRRVSPQEDLMSALVQAEEAGDKLSQDELLAMSFLLLVAGMRPPSTSSPAARSRSSNSPSNWKNSRPIHNSSSRRSRSCYDTRLLSRSRPSATPVMTSTSQTPKYPEESSYSRSSVRQPRRAVLRRSRRPRPCAIPTSTSPSGGAAFTTASGRHWPGWRPRSLSLRYSNASPT
jgi:hypothetical protein